MWRNGNPALHIADTETGFQNAIFNRGKTAENLWTDFINCWPSFYIGFPEFLRLDREPSFHFHGIPLKRWKCRYFTSFYCTEAHNSRRQGERYHHFLRIIFHVICYKHPNLDNKAKLRLFIKAMDDTVGPKGLVPSLLVFGTLSSFIQHYKPPFIIKWNVFTGLLSPGRKWEP